MSNTPYHQIYDTIYSKRECENDVFNLVKSDIDIHNVLNLPTLDFGCGTGLYTKALSKCFNEVSGFDIDKDAKRQFKKNNENLVFHSNYSDFNLEFGSIFSFFNVFNYISNEEQLREVLSELSNLLEDSIGLFYLDILNADEFDDGTKLSKREVSIDGKRFQYIQFMECKNNELIFKESVEDNKNVIFQKSNSLKLWKAEDLAKLFKEYELNLIKKTKSNFINKNQIRLKFQKGNQ